jgi:hypothetical protein
MKDGGISGNIAQGNNVSGGGVFVNNSGKFTMNSPAVAGASGSIKGNTCSGAVSNVYNGGTVNGSANPNPLNITNGLLW